MCTSACAAYQRRGLFARRGIDITYTDDRAAARKMAGGGTPEPTAGARDQDHLAG